MQSNGRLGAFALLFTLAFLGRAMAAPSLDGEGAPTSELPTVNFVQNPSWTARPNGNQVADVFPERAQRMAMSGAALVSCLADKDGSLNDCSVVVEAPANQGFGVAAVKLMRFSKLVPQTADGRSIEGARVNFPVRFRMSGEHPPPGFRWEAVPESSGPPAEVNVAAAISDVCVPYVLDRVDSAMLPTNHIAGQDDGWRGLMFPQPNATVLRIGAAGFVHVAIYTAGDTRHCDVSVARADPAGMRAVILKALAARPEGFSPARSRYLPLPFETENLLCAQPGSARPGGFARLSAGLKSITPSAILFTLTDSPARIEACDHEGVALQDRTLAAP